jgi:hypothetical protein
VARIGYVDHSYHRRTGSTDFIRDILRKHGHVVDTFWDESWHGGRSVPWSEVCGYDAVIMFQCFCPPTKIYFHHMHPNLTYIPMLDQFGIWKGPTFHWGFFWEPFQGCKALNFSYACHAITVGFGVKSLRLQYFQQPLPLPSVRSDGLHGFFWLRCERQLPWRAVRKLISRSHFDSFHIHVAPDSGSEQPELPSKEECRLLNITMSSWFEKKEDFNRVLNGCNVYFAPRMEEGIGQSFLEAFSRGQCVVGADQGTMNEYLLHGVNGLLFDSEDPQPLDFSRAVKMGYAGWQAAREGYARWVGAEEKLLRFILTPSEEFYRGKYDHFAQLPIDNPNPSQTGECHEEGKVVPALASDNHSPSRASMRERMSEWPIVRKTRSVWLPLRRIIRR